MKRPPLATWLLNQALSSPMRESVLGDLIEQYQRGRSRFWFWRQVLMTLLAESWNDIRDHQNIGLLHLVASSHWDEPKNPQYTLGVGAVRPVGVSKLAETWNSNISCS
jgi:hypothetical protein